MNTERLFVLVSTLLIAAITMAFLFALWTAFWLLAKDLFCPAYLGHPSCRDWHLWNYLIWIS